MNTELRDVLIRAKALIAKPSSWTRGALARPKNRNKTVASKDPDAVCWCAIGALSKACEFKSYESAFQAEALLNRIAVRLDPRMKGTPMYNDNHTHSEVMSLFDAAIAEVESIPL